MYTSVSQQTPGSGAQLNFLIDEGCGLRLGIHDHISRDQVEADARDGCMRCHYTKACIDWASSHGLISSGHTRIKCTIGGNLEILGANDSTPVVELQCWRQGQAPEVREACGGGRIVAYGDPESWRVPSNAGCFLLPSKTSSRKTFAFIKKQLMDCISMHAECCSDMSQSVVALQKFRLLEIGNTHLKLVSAKLGDRYACLSHCWGVTPSVIKTTRGTLEAFSTSGIVLTGLPKTFRDAVRVCCKLRIRLIWIDSLCIVQDDSDDWFDQAGRMASIFDNAYLTIAASKAKDSASGCFSKVERVYRGLPLPGFNNIFVRSTLPFPLQTSWLVSYADAPKRDENMVKQYWPLFTRAWVYQEILLSKRVVHFGAKEVLWQCGSNIQQQGTIVPQHVIVQSAPLPRTLRSNDYPGLDTNFVNPLAQLWHVLVSDYGQRELTFSEDRLPAIAALARYVSGLRQNDAYMAGLWYHTLLYDLTWCTRQLHDGHRDPEERQSPYNIPTWSWANCSLPRYNNIHLCEMAPFANTKVLTSTCTTEGGPFTGRIKDAAILIEAALISFKNIHQKLGLRQLGAPDKTRTEAEESENLMQPLDIFKPAKIRASWDQCTEADKSPQPTTYALPLLYFELPPNYSSTIMTALLIQRTHVTVANDQVKDPRYGQVCYKKVGIVEVLYEREDFETEYEDVDFDQAGKECANAVVKRVEALETHVVTLI